MQDSQGYKISRNIKRGKGTNRLLLESAISATELALCPVVGEKKNRTNEEHGYCGKGMFWWCVPDGFKVLKETAGRRV